MTVETGGDFHANQRRILILKQVDHVQVGVGDDFDDSFRAPGGGGNGGQPKALVDLRPQRIVQPRDDSRHAEDVFARWRAATILALSEGLAATNASAVSIPASSKISRSKPMPCITFPL